MRFNRSTFINMSRQARIAIIAMVGLFALAAVILYYQLPKTLFDRASSSAQVLNGGQLREISLDQLKEMVDKKSDFTLVDVRTEEEFISGHIAGSYWIDVDEISIRYGELDKNKLVVTICDGGTCERSKKAATALTELGFHQIAYVPGGVNGWVKVGFPIIQGAPLKNTPIGSLDVDLLQQKIRNDRSNFMLVDIREGADFAAGHIPSAKSIPFKDVRNAIQTGKIPKSTEVIFYDTADSRAPGIVQDATVLGLPNVKYLSGGFKLWTSKQYSVEK